MANILLTGGLGFIGSNAIDWLLNAGHSVHCIDDLSSGKESFLPHRQVSWSLFDFASPGILRDVESGKYDTIVHLAARARVGYSVEHPVESNEENVSKTLKLLDAARLGKIKKFVFASSSSVYGDAKRYPTQEGDQKSPRSPYALQKSIIEDYLQVYADLYGFNSIALRFFNVFGPNQMGDSPYSTAIGAWISAIKHGRPLRSDGDGEQRRDLCYVDNVCSAITRAVSVAKSGSLFKKYNVAIGTTTSNNEILAYLEQKVGRKLDINHAPTRPGDVRITHADISNACCDLGYEPLVDVWQGIDKTYQWAMNCDYFR